MSFATEFYDIGKEAFETNNSSSFAKLLADDYVMITPQGTRTRQEILDWIDEGKAPVMSNLLIIYDNEDIVVCYHDADTIDPEGNAVSFTVMCCGKKRGSKIHEWRVARAGDKT